MEEAAMRAEARHRLAVLDAVGWPVALLAWLLHSNDRMGGILLLFMLVLFVWGVRRLQWALDDAQGIDRGRTRVFWFPGLVWVRHEAKRGPYQFLTVRLAKLAFYSAVFGLVLWTSAYLR
jgi:hypothetical protein